MVCNCCNIEKTEDKFPKTGRICKECGNHKQRVRRKSSNNVATKRYEKTKKGYLMRTYRNMKSRVTGVLKKKRHLYEGLGILSKEDFYVWAIYNKDFNKLFDNWEKENYDRKLSPSIDRKDSSIGYIKGNIQWLTHSENSIKGAISKNKNKQK